MTVNAVVAERSSDNDVIAAIQELQRLKFSVVAGSTAVANIAVTGILTEDTIVAVLRLDRDATAANINLADVTSEASITSNGNIQLTTTNTTGDTLVVVWFNKN
jgi:hypothetical protein